MPMDISKLPPEILEQIFFYMNEVNELLKLRLVCRQWNSIIIAEHFLNTYFTRRLSSSTIDWYWDETVDRSTTTESSALLSNENMERKFPPTLCSGRIIAPPTSRYSDDINIYFRAAEHVIDKFIDTFSFWVYLPTDQPRLDHWFIPLVSLSSGEVRRGNFREFGDFFELLNCVRPEPSSNSWLHIAFTRQFQCGEHTGDEHFNVWLNGRSHEKCILNGSRSSRARDQRIHGQFIFQCREGNVTEAARIADLQIFRRSLSKLEIEAIAHQCTSPNNVKVGQYFLQKRHRANAAKQNIQNSSISNHHKGLFFNLIRLFIGLLRRIFSWFF